MFKFNSNFKLVSTLFFSSYLLSACGGGSGNSNNTNSNPNANAGDDQSVNELATVNLAGSGTDSDGAIRAYLWTQTGGDTVTLNNASSQNATFTAPTLTEEQTLSFSLRVTDDDGASASDSVSITVSPVNAAPTANAGADREVDEQTVVNLTDSSTDSDGSIASYAWSQTGGNAVTLNDVDTANASFTAPTLTEATIVTFSLTVTDNEGATDSDEVSLTINPVNALPVVNTGADQEGIGGVLVELAGGATDADGEVLTYQWAQTSGDVVTLGNTDTNATSFTPEESLEEKVYVFALTATDNEGGETTDSITVTVEAACEIDPAKVFEDCLPGKWLPSSWDQTEQRTTVGASGESPNVTWSVIDSGDPERNMIFDVQFSHQTGFAGIGFNARVPGTRTDFFWDPENPLDFADDEPWIWTRYDLSNYAENGFLRFDFRVVNYGPDNLNLGVNLGCEWPCESQSYTFADSAAHDVNIWYQAEIPVANFINDNGENSLDIENVLSIGFGNGWASDDSQLGLHFQLDNIRFENP